MTQMEFETFVSDDLKGRWPKWEPSPAILSDWYDLLRYHSVEGCRQAVRDHKGSATAIAVEPKIHEVRKLLRAAEVRRVAVDLATPLVPWVRCVEAPADHSEWQDREWVRLEHRMTSCIANHRHVAEAASRAAADIQAKHGGKWCGVVRPDGQLPAGFDRLSDAEARAQVRRDILDGPDGPERRFVLGLSRGQTMRGSMGESMSLPAAVAAPAKTSASREDLDKLEAPFQPRELPEPAHASMSDKEFFAANAAEYDDQGWEQG